MSFKNSKKKLAGKAAQAEVKTVPKPSRNLFSRTDRQEPATIVTSKAKVFASERMHEKLPTQAPQSGFQSLNISQLRASFDTQAPNRMNWLADDYSVLIQKLDRLQTEAFILKGRLLSEAKEKFFSANKIGWAEFCNSKLKLNYTTANQYIRVALEFDVTSHQYPELGFEHFKALLPVDESGRKEVLEVFSEGSVKALRIIVAERIQKKAVGKELLDRTAANAKQLMKALQVVHMHLGSIDPIQLSSQLRWQISTACNQVASSLLQFSAHTAEPLSEPHSMVNSEMMNSKVPSRSGGVTTFLNPVTREKT